MKQCNRCGSSLSLIDYYRHRIECRAKGRTCVNCHKTFELLSSYHLHIATCLKRIVDRQRMKSQLRNFLPSKGLSNEEETETTKLPKSDVEEAVPLKGPNYSTVCSLCQQSFRSVHLFRLHLAREGLCRPKPYICHTCNREFMSSYHLLSHEKRKKPCVPKGAVASKGGLKVKFVRKKPKDVRTVSLNMFNSESSNSVASEDEYSSIKNKHFYEQKTGYEYKEPGYLGSLQQYGDKNFKQRCTCKACGLAFLCGEDLQKHFTVSPMCAVRNDKVLEMNKHLVAKQSEVKQTARKSVSSSNKNMVDLTKNELSVLSNQNQGHNLPSRVAFGAKFVGQEGFTGSKKSKQDMLLVQTQNSNYNEVDLSCSICCLTFPDAETLQAHRKVHSMEKNNYASKCPVCFQVFGNAFLLFSHQKKHQHWERSARSKPTGCKCPFCDKVFLYVRSRNAHLRGHADVDSISIENFLKKTTCEVCSLAFVSENQKIQHRKVEHPDWTDALPKLFSNFDLRNQDSGKRSHDQKRPLEQKQDAVPPPKKLKVLVNVTPSLKAKLKAHPNTCPICFKQYSTTFVRNRHFRMHILDKAFECKWCPMKFHRSEPLNAHMQKEHNDKLGFECLVCGLRYLTKFRVLQHITKSHNSQSPQKLVRECETPPLPDSMKKTVVSFKNGSITSKTENRTTDYEGKNEYNKSKTNQDFYCEVCETSFLKLCGLQRHRQSKNHKDILATKDQQTLSNINKDDSPSPVAVSVQSHSPTHQQQQEDPGELIDDVRCSVCFRYYTSIIDFVPHRLSHFHHTGLSEITELNPYICELCSTPVDHHQKVQCHLLHHLQRAKARKAKLPPWKFTFTPRNYQISPIRIPPPNIRPERPPTAVHQVAKKTMNYNKTERPIQKEPATLSGIHRNIFTCDACNVVFTTKHHYSAHIRRYCPVRKAAMTADERIELEKSPSDKWHMEDDYSKLACRYCSLEFETVDELGWHEKSCRKVNGPVNGSLEEDVDEFLYCKACECLFPFEHSYIEHRKVFCFSDESLEKLLLDSEEDENLNHLRSAIELEAGSAGCVQCSMVFLSVLKLSEHMACHIANGKQFPIPGEEEMEQCLEETDNKDQEQKIHQTVPKTSENCGKISFNIADILSDSNTNKRCDSINSVSKVAEVGILSKPVENFRKEEQSINEKSSCNSPLPDDGASLRADFAHLLYILVADSELMEQLGWGQRPIDVVLYDVLKHMGHTPVTSEQISCDLDRLRQNIQILLETCISDDIMTNVSGSRKTIDTIVTEVLQMCRTQTNDVPALPSLVTQINM